MPDPGSPQCYNIKLAKWVWVLGTLPGIFVQCLCHGFCFPWGIDVKIICILYCIIWSSVLTLGGRGSKAKQTNGDPLFCDDAAVTICLEHLLKQQS